MIRRSKIRWNLGEKASALEQRPPQLVIRRFLPAFMRPFHAVFIGKVSPSVRPRGRGGGGGGGEREREEPAKILARASRSHVCAAFLCSFLLSSPARRARTRLARGERECARARAPLSSSLIEYSPLYLRMPVEIYRRSRCPFRFNPLQRRPLFPFPCVRLHRLMLFPPPPTFLFLRSAPSSTLPRGNIVFFMGTTWYARK